VAAKNRLIPKQGRHPEGIVSSPRRSGALGPCGGDAILEINSARPRHKDGVASPKEINWAPTKTWAPDGRSRLQDLNVAGGLNRPPRRSWRIHLREGLKNITAGVIRCRSCGIGKTVTALIDELAR
jgi:hypothetical protein